MKNKVYVDSHYRDGHYVEGYYRNFPSKDYYSNFPSKDYYSNFPSKGFTRRELSKAFDKLTTNLDDWRMPIHTRIHVDEWYLMSEACELFTGSKLWHAYYLETLLMERFLIVVKADGYYKAVKDERLRLKNEKG